MHNTDLFPAAATAAAPVPAKDVPKEGVGPGITVDEIPDKLYFRIGEVARLAGIKPYVLRFWETEFPGLGPKKSGTGHRLYRRKDVQMVLDIKTLLYEKRYTIEGARKHLETRPKVAPLPDITPKRARGAKALAAAAEKKPAKGQVSLFDAPGAGLDSVRKELSEILQMLK
ncbi:MAG: MerR family transcriptional regulator [Acidobacteriota bacterium]